MKTSLLLLLVAGGVVAGTIVFLNRAKTPPAPDPIAQSAPTQSEPPAVEKVSTPKTEAPAIAPAAPIEPAPVATTTPAIAETNSPASTNAISKAVDALLSARSGEQKHALFQQLGQSGQLEAVIAELKQRAAADPNNAAIPTTLGEAQLNQVRVLHESGADTDQVGILAMQADQSFNAALKIDPANWEAQFVKAASMFYWPADPARDADVVHRLSSLIDQQEGLPAQPEFAQSYVVLGNEYQKMGKQAEAIATWQLGAQKFPTDPTLQKKLSGQ
jgi:tetratricopeptide (TPR) repeat protein